MLGTGAMIVTDERDCMVDATRRLLRFYVDESCGKCTPCREGTWWALRVLERLENGLGRPEDLPLLEDLCGNMLFRGFCPLVDGAVSPMSSTLEFFRDEYEAHIRERRCPFSDRPPMPATAGDPGAPTSEGPR
jgi:NADH-quinone oxidoreductase subunit F